MKRRAFVKGVLITSTLPIVGQAKVEYTPQKMYDEALRLVSKIEASTWKGKSEVADAIETLAFKLLSDNRKA